MDTKLTISLQRAEELLVQLREEYSGSLEAKIVSIRAQQLTHEVLERLRSALDRLARRYWQMRVSPSLTEQDRTKAAVYFPITSDEHEFESTLGRWRWKTVKHDHSAVYQWLLDRQPFFADENKWLKTVDDLAVQGKHIDLVPQKRTEERLTTVSRGAASVSWGSGVSFSGNVSILGAPIDPRTQRIVPTEGLTERVEVWVSFLIEGYGVEAVGFCSEALKKTAALVEDMSNRFDL